MIYIIKSKSYYLFYIFKNITIWLFYIEIERKLEITKILQGSVRTQTLILDYFNIIFNNLLHILFDPKLTIIFIQVPSGFFICLLSLIYIIKFVKNFKKVKKSIKYKEN